MARLMIRSEVPVLLFGIPFVFNILKQHPALTKMVHRSDGGRLRWTVPFRKRAGTAADYAEENARTVKEYEAAEGDAVFGEDDGASEGEVETVPVVEDRKEKAKPKAKAAATRTPAPNPDGEDVFDEVTNDPAACRAIETCLWEITALSSHWNPSIAAQSAAFSTKWVSQRKQVDVRVGFMLTVTFCLVLESRLVDLSMIAAMRGGNLQLHAGI
jgi:CBF/Mak21 family